MITKKKRIVMIGLKGLPPQGGAATVGHNIIQELKDKFDFTVLSVSSHAKIEGKVDGYTQVIFPAFFKGGINTFVYYIRCLLYCRQQSFDLIHLHHGESGFITPFLKKKYKVITTLHGVLKEKDPKFSWAHNRFFRFAEKLNIRQSDLVVSVSRPDQEFVLQKYGRQIEYIPNSVTVMKVENCVAITEPYIFFGAGRIYQIKGLHFLLKAAHQLKLKIPILIAGDLDQVASYRDEIMALAKDLNVKFLGLIRDKEELIKLLNRAQFFVFPSTTEAMSIMLLEAVSAKVPIIASNIKPNRAIFGDEEMLYFQSEDAEDLGEKIKFAIRNESKMKDLAEKAYKRLVTEYTGEVVGSQYDTFYKSLMN